MSDPLCLNDRTIEACRVEPLAQEPTPAAACTEPRTIDEVRTESPRVGGTRTGDCSLRNTFRRCRGGMDPSCALHRGAARPGPTGRATTAGIETWATGWR